MPLLDHFHPPVSDRIHWRSFHAQWPAMTVQHLNSVLPDGYRAHPSVTLGREGVGLSLEVDLGAFDQGGRPGADDAGAYAPGAPTREVALAEEDGPIADELEVRIISHHTGGDLVAVVEFVSPANKDRPGSRRAFVMKCMTLLRAGLSVTIVDIVTTRKANLQRELIWDFGIDAGPAGEPAGLYAATSRFRAGSRLASWDYPLELGRPLATVPLWLDFDFAVPLDLEATYRDTCRIFGL